METGKVKGSKVYAEALGEEKKQLGQKGVSWEWLSKLLVTF